LGYLKTNGVAWMDLVGTVTSSRFEVGGVTVTLSRFESSFWSFFADRGSTMAFSTLLEKTGFKDRSGHFNMP
jgi:hypothetical protein